MSWHPLCLLSKRRKGGGEAGKGRKETREAGRGGEEGKGREGRVKMGKTFVLFIKLIGFGY